MYANVAQLSRMLKVSRQTIYAWSKQPDFPKPLPGTTVRNINDVCSWVKNNKTKEEEA